MRDILKPWVFVLAALSINILSALITHSQKTGIGGKQNADRAG